MPALDPSATTVTLRPRLFDRLCVCLLVLPGLLALVIAGLYLHGPKQATLECDRAAHRCEAFFPTLFGGGDRYSYDLGDLRASKVVRNKDGTSSWQVERTTKPLWLGGASKKADVVADYQRMAAAFQAFLDDPQRATYATSFTTIGGAPWPMFVVLGAVLCCFGFRWWRGWYATLELDPAGTITIDRRPMFFLGPRRVTRARAELRFEELVGRRSIGRGQTAKFAQLALRDAGGKRVFRYTTLYDGKSKAVLDGHMALLREFFAAS